jgi:hypothetical protein
MAAAFDLVPTRGDVGRIDDPRIGLAHRHGVTTAFVGFVRSGGRRDAGLLNASSVWPIGTGGAATRS